VGSFIGSYFRIIPYNRPALPFIFVDYLTVVRGVDTCKLVVVGIKTLISHL
jgi:hypothetical protein